MRASTPMAKWAFLLAVIMILFFYVWPGVCRYTYNNVALRTDRLTGKIQELMPAGEQSEYRLTTYRSTRRHWHSPDGCPSCDIIETSQQARARMRREREQRRREEEARTDGLSQQERLRRDFWEYRDRHR